MQVYWLSIHSAQKIQSTGYLSALVRKAIENTEFIPPQIYWLSRYPLCSENTVYRLSIYRQEIQVYRLSIYLS
jgi:hypothetical protein